MTHTAQEVLAEAYGYLLNSYWIKGREFSAAVAYWNGHDYNWSEWEKVEKFIPVPIRELMPLAPAATERSTAKITGVCSVGALSLAGALLNDRPLRHWHEMVDRDSATWLASIALGMAVRDWQLKNGQKISGREISDTVTSWNDDDCRTKEQVLEVFQAALNSPLLTASHIYEIRHSTSGTSFFYVNKQEAVDIVNNPDDSVMQALSDEWLSDAFYVQEFETATLTREKEWQ